MAYVSDKGVLHYYTVSPTTAKNSKMKLDSAFPFVGKDPLWLVAKQYQSLMGETSKQVGLAKDGHIIWGPINPRSQQFWDPCDVDLCNGFWDGGSYGYASTLFHPYTIGCWGSGNYPENLSH